MWTCPVCTQESNASFCTKCGFDYSTYYEQFPTLQILPATTQTTSGLRKVYAQKSTDNTAAILDALTDFTVIAYRYAWVPQTSRLEQQHKQFIRLGDARDFFNSTCWLPDKFAQALPEAGQMLSISISYKYRGQRKLLNCAIPAIQCTDFWRIGLKLDPDFRLTLFLGSGGQLAKSAPVALDLT